MSQRTEAIGYKPLDATRMTMPVYTMDDVAERLHKSRRWLQDFIQEYPFYRLAGRTKLFTEGDIARLIEALPCPGSSSRPAKAKRRTGTSAESTSESLWTAARELLRNERPGRSSARGGAKPNVVSFPSPAPSSRRRQRF